MSLLNQFFSLAIRFHDVPHGLQVVCGTGTAPLKSKLIQHLTAMIEAFLHKIFLNLHMVFVSLDRDSCLEILVGYDVGSRALWLVRKYWGQLTMVEKVGIYYGSYFKG